MDDIFAGLPAICSPMNVRGVFTPDQPADAVTTEEDAYAHMGTERVPTLGANENERLHMRMISLDDDDDDDRRARMPRRIRSEDYTKERTARDDTYGNAQRDLMAITPMDSAHAALRVINDGQAPRLASPFASARINTAVVMQLDMSPPPMTTTAAKRKRSYDRREFHLSPTRRGITFRYGEHRGAGVAAVARDHFVSRTIPDPHARDDRQPKRREVESDTIAIDTAAKKRQTNSLPRADSSDMFTSSRKGRIPVQEANRYGCTYGHQLLQTLSEQQEEEEEGAITLEYRVLSSPPFPLPSARRRLSFGTSNVTSSAPPVYEKNALDSMHGGDAIIRRSGSLGIYEHALELIHLLRHNGKEQPYALYDMSESANIYGSSMASTIVNHAYRKRTGRSHIADDEDDDEPAMRKARELSKKRFYDVMNILAGMNMIIRVNDKKKRYFCINHTYDAETITTRMPAATLSPT